MYFVKFLVQCRHIFLLETKEDVEVLLKSGHPGQELLFELVIIKNADHYREAVLWRGIRHEGRAEVPHSLYVATVRELESEALQHCEESLLPSAQVLLEVDVLGQRP